MMVEKVSSDDIFAKKLVEDQRNVVKKFAVDVKIPVKVSVPVVEQGSKEPFRYVKIGDELFKYSLGEMGKIKESILQKLAEQVEKQLS